MKQSGRRAPNKPRPRRSRKRSYGRAVTFPQAKGRTVEAIKLFAEHRSILIHFQDNTDLEIMVHPALSFTAALYDWKSGSQRVLKRWPRLNGG
jgi:hypothetical protein